MSKGKKKDTDAGVHAHLVTDGFIVLKAGRACTIENVSGKKKGGVLKPVATEKELAARFLKWRDARRVIERTERCAAALRGSMIDEWARERAPFLFEPGQFTIQPLGRQG